MRDPGGVDHAGEFELDALGIETVEESDAATQDHGHRLITAAELQRYADEAARVFLSAYGRTGPLEGSAATMGGAG